jgi:hypothetical protein
MLGLNREMLFRDNRESYGQLLRRLSLAAAAILAVSSARADSDEDNRAAMLALTPQGVCDLVQVKDDDLDTIATFSSSNAFHLKHGFFSDSDFHPFLRAFIDKRSGATTFQVYEHTLYSDTSWRFYNSATYATAAGPVASAVTVIDREVNSCDAYGECSYTEDIAFDVPEATLRAIAASYTPNTLNLWLFKFGAHSGDDLKDGLMPAEVAGLLMAVDHYRQTHSIAATPKP